MADELNAQPDAPRHPGNPSRKILYATAAKYAPEAIEVLLELMRSGDNDSVKLGAAKTILSKSIPDLHAQEITGEGGGPVKVQVVTYGEHDPLSLQFRSQDAEPASVTGLGGQSPISGAELASKGEEDNPGDKPISKVG